MILRDSQLEKEYSITRLKSVDYSTKNDITKVQLKSSVVLINSNRYL